MVIGVVALWTLTHRYLSLMFDGELYGVQALARLHPQLAADLYLADTSQDQFTLFSPLYAAAIHRFGLQSAGCVLFALFRAGYLLGAWLLMARLTSRPIAWLSVGALVCVIASYGGYGVFETASDYLTARTLAEALVALAIAAYFYSRLLAAVLLVAALTMHPLMALPGILLLVCLSLPARVSIGLFCASIAGIVGLALAVTHGLVSSRFLVVMDGAWLEVVRERSQYLFLNYWRVGDWETQARPYLSLALASVCVSSQPLRQLSLAAVIVGLSGLLLAAVAGSIGPIAILLQGQAWRWMWVTGLVAILLVAPAAQHLWHSKRCGRLCAVLLVAGWTFPPVDGTLCVGAALVLWLLNARVSESRERFLQYAAYLLIGIIGFWTVRGVLLPDYSDTRYATALLRVSEWLRGIFSLQALALVLFAGLVWLVCRGHWTRWAAGVLCAALFALATPTLLSGSGVQALRDRQAVAAWRGAIPESSSVLLLPLHKTASFPWFTLERPSYLSLTQSAGVVFSSATAAEVRRRSEVLKPLADPDWRLLTLIRAAERHETLPEPNRPLTTAALQQVCADPALGFVVAREAVGFDPITNTSPGRWKDWNLYDCRTVRGP